VDNHFGHIFLGNNRARSVIQIAKKPDFSIFIDFLSLFRWTIVHSKPGTFAPDKACSANLFAWSFCDFARVCQNDSLFLALR